MPGQAGHHGEQRGTGRPSTKRLRPSVTGQGSNCRQETGASQADGAASAPPVGRSLRPGCGAGAPVPAGRPAHHVRRNPPLWLNQLRDGRARPSSVSASRAARFPSLKCVTWSSPMTDLGQDFLRKASTSMHGKSRTPTATSGDARDRDHPSAMVGCGADPERSPWVDQFGWSAVDLGSRRALGDEWG